MDEFQSTRPIRGATTAEERTRRRSSISIHAPHTGRDAVAWGLGFTKTISIHAPHTGRDHQSLSVTWQSCYFNPRAPYGARPCPAGTSGEPAYFNPRAPYGARRHVLKQRLRHARISIHAPHTGRDVPVPASHAVDVMYFNPRAPYGARRCETLNTQKITKHFNPRAPSAPRRRAAAL